MEAKNKMTLALMRVTSTEAKSWNWSTAVRSSASNGCRYWLPKNCWLHRHPTSWKREFQNTKSIFFPQDIMVSILNHIPFIQCLDCSHKAMMARASSTVPPLLFKFGLPGSINCQNIGIFQLISDLVVFLIRQHIIWINNTNKNMQ